METKPHYLIAGLFVTVFSIIFIAIVLWILGVNFKKEFDVYMVYTNKSVSGLNPAANVLYKGIHVGNVKDIVIDSKDPEYIKIFINVERNIPITTSTRAQIIKNGMTGISYVDLVGSSAKTKLLKNVSKAKYPKIPLRPSKLDILEDSAKKIIKNTNTLLEKMNSVFDNSSIRHLKNIGKNTDILTYKLIKNTDELKQMIKDGDNLIKYLDVTNVKFNRLLKESQITVKNVDTTIKDNQNGINAFTNNTLTNVNDLIMQMNYTLKDVRGLIIEIKENPSVLIRNRQPKKGPGE